MGNIKSILFIPPVHWNYYPYRDQELPTSIAGRGIQCIYLNPVSYRGSEKSMRFKQLYSREDHQNIRVIDRTSRHRKSLLEYINEVLLNIRSIRDFKPDAVISSDHLTSFGACIYCRYKQIRFVFDVTDHWELVDRSMAGKLYKFVLKSLLAKYSFAITCTSKRQFNSFQKRRKTNTFLISNGINPRLLQHLDMNRKQQAFAPEVNFIGSLRDWYDFDLLLEVFREFPDINLHIYGLGPLYIEILEKSRSIPNVHVHGNVDQNEVPAILNRTLFGILPLKVNELNHSTCPIKLFDYWGASKAVISTPVEEISRLGGDTLLYASTRKEFSRNIKLLLNDAKLSAELGRKGREKIDKIHNYEVITDRFLNILNTS